MSISKWAVFENANLMGERCELPQRTANTFACILGWELPLVVTNFGHGSPWPYFYMGISNTFPKLGRIHYGMDPIGLRSGQVRTQDTGKNRRLWLYIKMKLT